jgi:hypothetical protein
VGIVEFDHSEGPVILNAVKNLTFHTSLETRSLSLRLTATIPGT